MYESLIFRVLCFFEDILTLNSKLLALLVYIGLTTFMTQDDGGSGSVTFLVFEAQSITAMLWVGMLLIYP